MTNEDKVFLQHLRDPQTIRLQANRLLDLAKKDALQHFSFHPENMQAAVDFVVHVITTQYPGLDIPYHSRWRHFETGNKNRIAPLLEQTTTEERIAVLFELVIISVLLDAGAGNAWHYLDPDSDKTYCRSEGLALASLHLYQQGFFSKDPLHPHRVDAQALINFKEDTLCKGFQVSTDNPLTGVNGRVALLNQLGHAIRAQTLIFGNKERLGDFSKHILRFQTHHTLSANTIFQAVLEGLHAIWPQRLAFKGIYLGDVGIHSALKTEEPGSEYIPFHKLSQWLTYSLLEPLEYAGLQVTHLDQLTGLPEYRNGGLLIDSGLLRIKNKNLCTQPQDPSTEAIVEWRALTVALLDELAQHIREQLHQDKESLPLAKILQGGTWEAGRQIARKMRPEGTPPIQIISDATIF